MSTLRPGTQASTHASKLFVNQSTPRATAASRAASVGNGATASKRGRADRPMPSQSSASTRRPPPAPPPSTISGPERTSWGCLLELTWNGTKPLTLEDGSQRTYLEDGDVLELRGWAGEDQAVDLGVIRNTVMAARGA